MELGNFWTLSEIFKYVQKYDFFMANFKCSFGLKSKGWQHQSWSLTCALNFRFKNRIKWSSVERDVIFRIWSMEMAFCPVTRAPSQAFHQIVHGHVFTIIFLLEILIILKNVQHQRSKSMCCEQIFFRNFLKIVPTFQDMTVGSR